MARKDRGALTGDPVTYEVPSPAGGVRMETFIPWTLVKRGVKRQVIAPIDAPEAFQVEAAAEQRERLAVEDTPLIRALGLAHYWQRLLDEGKYRSITAIAAAEGLDLGHANRIARLTQLAPDVVDACAASGEKGPALEQLMRRGFSADWREQCLVLLPSCE
jgi:hypothetical protein